VPRYVKPRMLLKDDASTYDLRELAVKLRPWKLTVAQYSMLLCQLTDEHDEEPEIDDRSLSQGAALSAGAVPAQVADVVPESVAMPAHGASGGPSMGDEVREEEAALCGLFDCQRLEVASTSALLAKSTKRKGPRQTGEKCLTMLLVLAA